MKRFITILVCTCCLLVVHPFNSIAQTDSLSLKDSTAVAEQAMPAPDDEFNIFLMVLAIGFFGAVLGAAAVGAFMAALFLLLAVLFVSLGIISASFIVGLYKKSFQSGFNTFIYITAIVLGILIGAVGFWGIAKILELQITAAAALATGGLAGIIGGLVISFTTIRLIRIASKYVMNKLNAS